MRGQNFPTRTDGQTDRHEYVISRFSKPCELTQKNEKDKKRTQDLTCICRYTALLPTLYCPSPHVFASTQHYYQHCIVHPNMYLPVHSIATNIAPSIPTRICQYTALLPTLYRPSPHVFASTQHCYQHCTVHPHMYLPIHSIATNTTQHYTTSPLSVRISNLRHFLDFKRSPCSLCSVFSFG